MEKEKMFEEIRSTAQATFKANLISLAVYGSAATEDFMPATSDINIVMVLADASVAQLEQVRTWRTRLRKLRLATPLVLTEEFIKTSADVFPIEFFEIKEKHKLLTGKDCFSKLKIAVTNLRHECEHELKGRVLRLRESYLEVGSDVKALTALLTAAHTANYPAFRTALRLKKVKPPLEQVAILNEVAKRFGVDASVLLRIRQLRRGELKLSSGELVLLMSAYLGEVEKIACTVDCL